MDLSEYLDYETFVRVFSNGNITNKTDMLHRAGTSIDRLSISALEQLIYNLFGAWPHILRKEILTRGVKRGMQRKFYEQLYGQPASESVIINDEQAKQAMNLRPERKGITVQTEVADEHGIPKKVNKHYKSEFAKKVSDMSVEALAKWAIEVGVPQERIDKHISKPAGLAKMNLGNLIRPKVT